MHRSLPPLLPLLPLLFLAACQEYGVNQKDGADGLLEDTDNFDACGEVDFSPEAIDADDACELAPQTGQFVPERQWKMDTFTEYSGSTDIMATAMVAHITDDDGDGVFGSAGDIPDIAVVTYGSQNVLRIISGDGSRVHWSAAADDPQGQSMPAVADLDSDGDPEIVIFSESGRAIAYHHDGSMKWASQLFDTDGGLFGGDPEVPEHCAAPDYLSGRRT